MTAPGACVRSGFCCKSAPCPFGRWNYSLAQCEHLEGDRPGRYSCGIHDEIIGQPGAEFVPAFGGGCCSPLNTDRRIVQLQEAGEIDSGSWPR